jgi:hypothetical protein
MLDIGNELAAAQHDGVIDEGGASFDSNHLLWKVLCLLVLRATFSPWLRNVLVLWTRRSPCSQASLRLLVLQAA